LKTTQRERRRQKGAPLVRQWNPLRHAAGILGAGSLLAACSAGGAFHGTTLAPQGTRLPFLSVRPPVVQRAQRRTWVSPDLKGANHVVFVSDIGNDLVDVFTLPSMTFKAQLTGFNEPQGECAARNGDVWITNSNPPNAILLYSHTGKLIKALNDRNEHPVACAVDQSTGDLAVSSIYAGSASGPGDVAIYKGGSGSPTVLTCSAMSYYYFITFGPSGTLYVDGSNAAGSYQLCGGNESSLSAIGVSGATIYFPGFLQWYNAGNYLAAGDQLCGGNTAACVYQLSINGSTATSMGVTDLQRSDGSNVCDLTSATFAGTKQTTLVGSDDEWCNNNRGAAVSQWSWPAGGEPINSNDSTLVIPEGAAVSVKQ
jgi:hypothetical protein